MQCVAQCCTVCCSVLQCVVVCCSVLQLSIQLPFEKNWRLCVVAQDAALIPMKFLKKVCVHYKINIDLILEKYPFLFR